MVNISLIKEARIYNGEKTVSSINGAGKTGQLGKGQFSFQSQRKAMPKNAQTTAQLH